MGSAVKDAVLRLMVGVLGLICFWLAAAHLAGAQLVPGPGATLRDLADLLATAHGWETILITFARGVGGVVLAVLAGVALGVPCGLYRPLRDILMPPVAALQGCPIIIWITLLMIWVGIGSVVPLAAIFVAAFPALFVNVMHGVAAIDRELFVLARVYQVGRLRTLRQIVLPGMAPAFLAGLSFSVGIAWKVAATAEFIASSSGIGSEIYWAYRNLDLPRLFSWAVVLIVLGIGLEALLLRPLRGRIFEAGES